MRANEGKPLTSGMGRFTWEVPVRLSNPDVALHDEAVTSVAGCYGPYAEREWPRGLDAASVQVWAPASPGQLGPSATRSEDREAVPLLSYVFRTPIAPIRTRSDRSGPGPLTAPPARHSGGGMAAESDRRRTAGPNPQR